MRLNKTEKKLLEKVQGRIEYSDGRGSRELNAVRSLVDKGLVEITYEDTGYSQRPTRNGWTNFLYIIVDYKIKELN